MSLMRAMMLAAALALPAGCAHRWGEQAATRDVRGSMDLAGAARLLLSGPAVDLHANVDREDPIALYVVDRVSGDDRDCARPALAGAATIVTQMGSHLELAAGRELCAMPTRQGTREVLWHARTTDRTAQLAHK